MIPVFRAAAFAAQGGVETTPVQPARTPAFRIIAARQRGARDGRRGARRSGELECAVAEGDVAMVVREIIAAHVNSGALPRDETALGANGLGLDSIAIAEVLLECEGRFGVSGIELLEGEPLTIGRLIAFFGDATAA